jgi:molybdopterin converting factor small subunit
MKVEVRLFATLRRYLPPGADATCTVLELPEGSRLGEVIDRLNIPSSLAQLVMVNGIHETDRSRVLQEGTVVSVFPPVAGGVTGTRGECIGESLRGLGEGS